MKFKFASVQRHLNQSHHHVSQDSNLQKEKGKEKRKKRKHKQSSIDINHGFLRF